MYIGLHVKYQLFLSDVIETWIFSTNFRKMLKCQISWKSVEWELSCSMRTDRRTDRQDEAISCFSQFSKAPKHTHTYWGNTLLFSSMINILEQHFWLIWEEENQLDATQCFTELVIYSTCFGHVYAHHQELATILLVWHVVCNSWLLVVGRSGAGQQAMRPEWGMFFDCYSSRRTSLTLDA